jgi:formylglycine-generating enzyme required for sulfatase activity
MTRERRIPPRGSAEDTNPAIAREGVKLSAERERQTLEILAAESADFGTLARIAGYDPARDFIGADLRGVDFGEDDLSGFVFRGADLVGANLSRARGLSLPMIEGARFDATTRLPKKLRAYEQLTRFWKDGCPSFVSAFGVDEFGQWLEFSVPGSDGEVTQRMRWIASGTFLMGSPDSETGRWDNEGPRHEVTISEGFWLFDTACPQRLWRAVMGGNNPSLFRGDDRPVETVSWNKVNEFLRRIEELVPGLQLELPSEALWEYACRGGSTTPFSFGDNITPEQVNYNGNFDYSGAPKKGLYRAETVPVGSLPPNAWGLHEMHGNVWEWCADGLREYRKGPVVDPLGSMNVENARLLRIMRGGSWGVDMRRVRSARRGALASVERNGDLGFRCVRVQDGAEPAEKRRVQRSGAERTAASPSSAAERVRWREGGSGARTFPGAETFVIRSERAPAEPIACPTWAAAIGRDRYGLWTRIEVSGSDGPVAQRMRWIDPGRFQMGSPDDETGRLDSEGPRHDVTIVAGFWLFETACSQALWTAVMGENPSRFRGEDRPVEKVSWNDAQTFIAAINERIGGLRLVLPSEAQWEYACRAGTATPFGFGENITPEQVNYNGNFPYVGAPRGRYREETVAGGSLPANRWGLHEMHGNVWEWCADAWHENYDGAPVDGAVWEQSGRTAERVLRGGSWLNDARIVRSAGRDASAPDVRLDDVGFRCARVQE